MRKYIVLSILSIMTVYGVSENSSGWAGSPKTRVVDGFIITRKNISYDIQMDIIPTEKTLKEGFGELEVSLSTRGENNIWNVPLKLEKLKTGGWRTRFRIPKNMGDLLFIEIKATHTNVNFFHESSLQINSIPRK
jgi:hypothetical protein